LAFSCRPCLRWAIRLLNADGTIGHVEVELDGSVVMMFDAQPGWPDLPAHLRVYVKDVQTTVDDAVAAGARADPRSPRPPVVDP
jgi:PhnB protein